MALINLLDRYTAKQKVSDLEDMSTETSHNELSKRKKKE